MYWLPRPSRKRHPPCCHCGLWPRVPAVRPWWNCRNRPWPFSAAILLAPLVRPAGWRRVQLAHRLLHRFADSVHREFTRNSSDQDFLAFLRRDPLQSRRISVRWVRALQRWLADLPIRDLGVGPALVLQGDVDGTVDWRYNTRAIATLFPGAISEVLPGAGHQLANESLAIRRAIPYSGRRLACGAFTRASRRIAI